MLSHITNLTKSWSLYENLSIFTRKNLFSGFPYKLTVVKEEWDS